MQDDLCKKVGVYFRGVHFGGNADNRAQAGLVYANANNTPSNANANIGSHLTYRISMSQGGKLNKNKKLYNVNPFTEMGTTMPSAKNNRSLIEKIYLY